MGVGCAGGALSLTPVADDTNTADVDESGLRLNGHGVDYETATSCTVTIQVTDNWSDPVSVPVTVMLKNVNELEFCERRLTVRRMTDHGANRLMVNGLENEHLI